LENFFRPIQASQNRKINTERSNYFAEYYKSFTFTLSEDYLIMTNKEALAAKIFCFNINHITSTAPFGFAAEYAHPIETMVLGVGTVIGPLVLTRHYFTVLVWLIVRLFQTVEAHCGYDFPWSPRHFIPFWGGAEFHDYHHETFVSFFYLA
jgi:hypothetical protein